ncbi:MAG: site-specific integrase [Bacteroidales bacterium]|nr:site-specific integrase [Bacteroidales bacterium]
MVLDYRPAHLVKGKNNYYVAYSCVNPESGKMQVRRVKLNYIKSAKTRKEYAEEVIKQINSNLSKGWNPFAVESEDKLILFSEAFSKFMNQEKRQLEDGVIKKATFEDYEQQLRSFANYLGKDLFCYKIRKIDIENFLDWLYIEKKRTAYTRNHYLQSIRTFFNFCVKKDYIIENPAAEIENAKNGRKKRRPIPDELLKQIFSHIAEDPRRKYYLLACWLLYGCFIRPSEICGLTISNISFKNQTIFIPESISKNKKGQTVTIPNNIAHYILELRLWEFPGNYRIIAKGFTPGTSPISDKQLRAEWLKIRKELKLPDCYQFYSLKDTGITSMLKKLDVAQVRDQARHSSIAITDAYTDRSQTAGNDSIKKLDFRPS